MTDKQIDGLERHILSMGRGLFDEVKITVNEYNWVDVGIYLDWQYFPKNHGVYKLKDSFLNKVHGDIDNYFKLSGLNQRKYMFNTVKKNNNFDKSSTEEPLNEIERDWRDKDYTDEYPKFRDKMLPILDNLVKSYGEDDKGNLSLFKDEEGDKAVFNYRSMPKELYYDNSISQYFTDYLPYYMWARHGKYLVYDYFKSQFPDVEVKYVTPANII